VTASFNLEVRLTNKLGTTVPAGQSDSSEGNKAIDNGKLPGDGDEGVDLGYLQLEGLKSSLGSCVEGLLMLFALLEAVVSYKDASPTYIFIIWGVWNLTTDFVLNMS